MSKNKQPKVYALTVRQLTELKNECNEQIENSKDLLQDVLAATIEEDSRPPSLSYCLYPLVEILFCNMTIADFIRHEFEVSDPILNEETGEEELMIGQQSFSILQSMVTSRYYANSALNKTSYSVSVH